MATEENHHHHHHHRKDFDSMDMRIVLKPHFHSLGHLHFHIVNLLTFQNHFKKKIPPEELRDWTENELREMKIDIDSIDLVFIVNWSNQKKEKELYFAGRQKIDNIPIFFEFHGFYHHDPPEESVDDDDDGNDSDDSGCDPDFRSRNSEVHERPNAKIFGDILFSKITKAFLKNCNCNDCFKERMYRFLGEPFPKEEEEEHACRSCDEKKKDKMYPRFHVNPFQMQ